MCNNIYVMFYCILYILSNIFRNTLNFCFNYMKMNMNICVNYISIKMNNNFPLGINFFCLANKNQRAKQKGQKPSKKAIQRLKT